MIFVREFPHFEPRAVHHIKSLLRTDKPTDVRLEFDTVQILLTRFLRLTV